MRKLLVVAVVAIAVVAAPRAAAEAPIIGKIIVTDGGWGTNRCTATPFVVPSMSKITVQCNQDVAVGTNVGGCDAGNCLTALAGEKFPTSTGSAVSLSCNYTPLADAGSNVVTHFGGHVAIQPVSAASVTCKVFPRLGTE